MTRIQAVAANQVPVYPAGSTVTVAVVDTGSTNLPDLNVVAGVGFSGSKNNIWADGDGHGTHVSGTIGGRNNGNGVYGSYPGIRIYPVKVLGDDGSGDLADVIAGIDHVASSADAVNIGVLSMSLGASVPASDPSGAAMCAAVAAAAAKGVIVVVAAGNEGADIATSTPSACPATVVVTAIDPRNNIPASWSNWQPTTASAAEQRRTLAGPGVGIYSTINTGLYDTYDGTSMATPHVSGVAARCYVAGDCKRSLGTGNTAKFLDAMWAKYTSDAAYRWSSNSISGGKFYGPLVWADKW